ncbi:unnamed protein product [Allacma fusca]|uniref:Uncharacterized protein n=1 Tax=Allacma fusca TaxID=39272 RepID=A0A8J2KLR5_9HEXA|nr:unnamed protein product [Allacma fusca]
MADGSISSATQRHKSIYYAWLWLCSLGKKAEGERERRGIPVPIAIDPETGEEVESSESIVFDSLNGVLVEDEEPNVGIALKVTLTNGGQIVIGTTKVPHAGRHTGWDPAETHSGDVDELDSGVPEETR